MKIGVVGYSCNNFNHCVAKSLLLEALSALIGIQPVSSIEVISGLTNIGIPKLAYQLADLYGWRKVGISASQAFQIKSGVYQVDKQIIVGNNFGDESAIFIDYIDYLIRIGGGKQSHSEVQLFIAKCQRNTWPFGQRLIQYELDLN